MSQLEATVPELAARPHDVAGVTELPGVRAGVHLLILLEPRLGVRLEARQT